MNSFEWKSIIPYENLRDGFEFQEIRLILKRDKIVSSKDLLE